MAVLLTFSVRVLNTTCRMDQASIRELLTFVEKNRIVREDDIKIFIRLCVQSRFRFSKDLAGRKDISSIKGTSFERNRERKVVAVYREFTSYMVHDAAKES